jgi:pyruvate kinase
MISSRGSGTSPGGSAETRGHGASERIAIVATLGPASSTPEAASALRRAGADRVRLNGSHIDVAGMRQLVRAAAAGGFPPEAVVLDLQGGKSRIAGLRAAEDVIAGQDVLIVPAASTVRPGTEALVLPVDRREFVDALRPGDTVRVDDGRVALEIVETANGRALALTLGAGRISDRKGVALVGREVVLPPRLLDADQALLEAAVGLGLGGLAVSYATDRALLRAARASAGRFGPKGARMELTAKIEQPAAVERLDDIAAGADALWLCRGDLGAEVGLERLPRIQQRVLAWAAGRIPLYVAGQVLHHMTSSPRPTRSEACHVADLVWSGVAGFVLSDETAQGPHGPGAVRWLRRIADAALDEGPPGQPPWTL